VPIAEVAALPTVPRDHLVGVAKRDMGELEMKLACYAEYRRCGVTGKRYRGTAKSQCIRSLT
jgi:hypothetical protein